MRLKLYGGTALLTAALLAACPSAARAQDGLVGFEGFGGGGEGTYPAPIQPSEQIPLPTGDPGTHGFYTFFEFMYLTSYRHLGDQVVAYRGLLDTTGATTTIPGIYIGSGQPALNTNQFPRQSYMPGFNIGLGYKLDDGTSIYGSYIYLMDRNYHVGATSATPFARSAQDLSDTFLVSGVFNFPPQFAGPAISTRPEQQLGGNIFYGIWNGASVMDIQFNQRFAQGEIGARVPMFQTEYSRIYGLAGGRFDWIFERFQWRTVEYDIAGRGAPFWTARYNNTLSQRMYGPYIGCGHEMYIGNRFSVSTDITAAGSVEHRQGADEVQTGRQHHPEQTLAGRLHNRPVGVGQHPVLVVSGPGRADAGRVQRLDVLQHPPDGRADRLQLRGGRPGV